jgi:alpha-ketoglutarate-dependent taurine dioxygenase
MPIEFKPLRASFGAEVIGAPADLALDDAGFGAIEAAWYRHSILLFRGLRMSPAQQIAFTQRFGPLHIMEAPNVNLDAHPEVFVVSNAVRDGKPLGLRRVGLGFHTDGEDRVIPNAGSLLYAIEVPPARGDTLFVDMYTVYDALPAETKRRVAGRRARFSRITLHHVHYPDLPALTEAQRRARPDVFHPLARRHPHSGRVALYIGRWACDVEGLPADEGRRLLAELQAFAEQPRFVYRHQWRVGDAILWDNRCTQHCATGFDDERHVRVMYRTTLEGELPVMAEPAV